MPLNAFFKDQYDEEPVHNFLKKMEGFSRQTGTAPGCLKQNDRKIAPLAIVDATFMTIRDLSKNKNGQSS